MKPVPIGILSDSPECPSGLARITRDLASRLYSANLPIRLATFGFNGHGSNQFPWTQYALGPFMSAGDIPKLIPAWTDFTRGEKGILMTIYDVHRLEAFRFPQVYGAPWMEFLKQQDFEVWGYVPVDGAAPNGSFTSQSNEILRAFDRILAYGPFGQTVLRTALLSLQPPHKVRSEDVEWLPHGIDPSVFHPMGKEAKSRLQRQVITELKDTEGRPIFRTINATQYVLGVVATNQQRKDWGMVFEVLKELGPEWCLWAHTDRTLGYWSLQDLAEQFGVSDQTFVTISLDDSELAALYCACDATLGPGTEGFGFPLLESLACNVPAVHTTYGGGADIVPADLRVPPLRVRPEGPYCLGRPVWDIPGVVAAIKDAAGNKAVAWNLDIRSYEWPTLWPSWKKWFQKGIEDFRKGREYVSTSNGPITT